jgi:hypothetical protein
MASQQYKYFPRSVSWQVASLLNPGLETQRKSSFRPIATARYGSRTVAPLEDIKPAPVLAASEYSRSGTAAGPPPSPPTTAYRWWHQQFGDNRSKVTLPPQYVSPHDLYNAMPRYSRGVKSQEETQITSLPTASIEELPSPIHDQHSTPKSNSLRWAQVPPNLYHCMGSHFYNAMNMHGWQCCWSPILCKKQCSCLFFLPLWLWSKPLETIFECTLRFLNNKLS